MAQTDRDAELALTAARAIARMVVGIQHRDDELIMKAIEAMLNAATRYARSERQRDNEALIAAISRLGAG